jgi:hypothetical protein
VMLSAVKSRSSPGARRRRAAGVTLVGRERDCQEKLGARRFDDRAVKGQD